MGAALREQGFEVFDDWFAASERADSAWQEYETARGHTYPQALMGYAATHVFEFDHHHLNRADCGVLVMPAGKSGHIELGYLVGQGKETYVLFDQPPDRWDVMYRFTNGVFFNQEDLIHALHHSKAARRP